MKDFFGEALISGIVGKMEHGVGLRHFVKVNFYFPLFGFILSYSAYCFYISLSLQVSECLSIRLKKCIFSLIINQDLKSV